jgi:hypothetical protein
VNVETVALLGGLLFLLIAVVGGGFTVRDVTIPQVPKWARISSAALGVVFTLPFILMLVVEPSPPAPAPSLPPVSGSPGTEVSPSGGVDASFFYNFDGEGIHTDAHGGRYVADASGKGHDGYVKKSLRQTGDLTMIPHSNRGMALKFLAPCPLNATSTCPRVIIEAADAADLDPGTGDFSFGADVLLQRNETGADSNIIEKGYPNATSQWKLRVELAESPAASSMAGAQT